MRTPLVSPRLVDGATQVHLGIEKQGNLIHQGGDFTCWCCPSCTMQRDERGRATAVYRHRRIGFN